VSHFESVNEEMCTME